MNEIYTKKRKRKEKRKKKVKKKKRRRNKRQKRMISEVEVLLLYCSLTKMGIVVWIDMACIQYIY